MEFEFEGVAGAGPMKGLTVNATLEAWSIGELPESMSRRLANQWKHLAEGIEGYGFVEEPNGPSPRLALSLYCQAAYFDPIFRAFAAGNIAPVASVSFEVYFDRPNTDEGQFWRSDWLHEWLPVRRWSVTSELRSVDLPG